VHAGRAACRVAAPRICGRQAAKLYKPDRGELQVALARRALDVDLFVLSDIVVDLVSSILIADHIRSKIS
jgi:hypothetical protein